MNGSNEAFENLIWIGRTHVLALVGSLLVGAALLRLTGWGRQFRLLAGDYFSPRRDWRPLAMAAGELPQAIVVSVGHRSTLQAFHTRRLRLEGQARWRLDDGA